MVYQLAAGSKAGPADVMDLIHKLLNAEFTWGFYDATRSIMKANKAAKIEDGRLLHKKKSIFG